MSVPSWVPEAVFYQIFPDRFARGAQGDPVPGCQPWGSTPTVTGFQGGDLTGIRSRLDYLTDLGINAIYLNPIFLATSTHRYNTYDYYQIDYRLGTLKDFKAFLDAAHRRGMRVILDGVFNHCGRGFFAFNDLLENQQDSLYRNWFHIYRYPVDAYSRGKTSTYAAWWGHKSLPKFNTDEPAVRRYLLGVARHWIEQGIDGWRLDVPNEIDDDSFWAEFRDTVCQANPEAYIFGEIWEIGPRWVNDNHFHGLMNYPLRQYLLDWLLGEIPTGTFARWAFDLWQAYPVEYRLGMYNLIGTHDRERPLTLLYGNARLAILGYQFLYAFPGTPSMYYGDEVGMVGGKDPDCRGAFPWDESEWNLELRQAVKALVRARQSTPALQRGDLSLLVEDQNGVCAFRRSYREDQVIAVFNHSAQTRALDLPLEQIPWPGGTVVRNLIGPGAWAVGPDALRISLPPHTGAWLQAASVEIP